MGTMVEEADVKVCDSFFLSNPPRDVRHDAYAYALFPQLTTAVSSPGLLRIGAHASPRPRHDERRPAIA
eukprot:121780-Prorocentrum_lima.AAC.1